MNDRLCARFVVTGLELAHALKVLLKAEPVPAADAGLERADLIVDRVEHAASREVDVGFDVPQRKYERRLAISMLV